MWAVKGALMLTRRSLFAAVVACLLPLFLRPIVYGQATGSISGAVLDVTGSQTLFPTFGTTSSIVNNPRLIQFALE